ncbi:MAG: hypothetical protein MK006_00285 [Pirellulales bacterium]|nr:hypothetical protein [Pirellulales bacterium]
MITRTIQSAISLLCVAVIALPVSAQEEPAPVSFRKDIAPILINNCLACHGPKKAEGGYRVDSYSRFIAAGDSELAAITASNLDDSESLRRILSDDEADRMPLEGDPLPQEQTDLISRWITEGAKYDAENPEAALSAIVPPPVYPDPPEAYPRSVPITAIAFSPDGANVVAGGYHELTVWNAADGTLVSRIKNVGQRSYAIQYSPDGALLAVGGGAPGRLGEVRLFDAASGELKSVVASTSDVILDVAFNPAGDRIALAGADGAIRIHEVATGAEQRVITSHSDWVMAIAWNGDGTRLASASRDKTSKLFNTENGELLVTYSGHGQPVKGVVFHPAGDKVFSSGSDNKIHLWAAADGKKASEVALGGEVYKLTRSGGFVFAPSADKTVRQFEEGSHTEVRSYTGNADWALAAAFHPETKRVVSGAFNGDVKIWNAEDGAEIATFVAAPGIAK